MKNSLVLFLLLIVSGLQAQSRSRNWGEFSMIPVTFNDRAAEADLIKSGPEYEKALKVYERVCEARGDLRYPVPIFVLTRNESVVAKISYHKPEKIYLGIKAFKVCESFKDQSEAAIAFLLGHELTHYYEKHAWRSEFADNNSGLTILKQRDSLFNELGENASQKQRTTLKQFKSLLLEIDEVAMEAQSDYLGGFLAYSAGFGAFERGDSLITRLYRAFTFDSLMEGYVTLSERAAMSRSSADRMKDLVEVFDMANLLSAIGRYGEAFQYYRFLLAEYQSREVYNNVGATAMMQALKLFTLEEQPYRYPVQLDLEMAKSRGDDDKEKRNALLRQAILHFDGAISLDPNYAPAYLNKACALTLLDDPIRARFYADVETRNVAKGKFANLINDVEVLLGILDAKTNTPEGIEQAKKRFSVLATQNGGSLAAYNLAVLNKTTSQLGSKEEIVEEEIDGQSIFLMEHEMDLDKGQLNIGQGLTFIRNPKKTPNAQLYTSVSPQGFTKFHITNTNYSGKTGEGIKRGATREEIINAYKAYSEHPKSIRTITGEILVYQGILFMLKDGKLDRWVVYTTPQ